MLPYWDSAVVPDLRSGATVLVAAHGNSLRAIVKHLDGISDDDIAGLNIPTGMPLVYRLDDELQPDRRRRRVPRPRRRRGSRGRCRQPGPLSRRPAYTAAQTSTGTSPVTTKTTRLATETAWSAIRS